VLAQTAALALRVAAGLAAHAADRLHSPHTEPEPTPRHTRIQQIDDASVFGWPARRPECFDPATCIQPLWED
jgi:hypothetical protein